MDQSKTLNKPGMIESEKDFWEWFSSEQKQILKSVRKQENVEDLLQKIIDQLHQLNDGLFCLIGMFDSNIAELVITPDGNIKNLAFAEDLVNAAPQMDGWKITALKPAMGFQNLEIEMNGLVFSNEKLKFYTNPDPKKPDDIEIFVVHSDYTPEKLNDIGNGTLLFLDNAIGEYNMMTQIDSIQFDTAPEEAELIPIEKLSEYLLWREKEFVEKYEAVRYNTMDDEYASFEADDEEGMPIIAVMNQELLSWDAKASHPWILLIEIGFDETDNGMPDEETFDQLNAFEDELMTVLVDSNGYLNIGRQTYRNVRTIFIALKDFREGSRVAKKHLATLPEKLKGSYSIFKDKYWTVVERFMEAL